MEDQGRKGGGLKRGGESSQWLYPTGTDRPRSCATTIRATTQKARFAEEVRGGLLKHTGPQPSGFSQVRTRPDPANLQTHNFPFHRPDAGGSRAVRATREGQKEPGRRQRRPGGGGMGLGSPRRRPGRAEHPEAGLPAGAVTGGATAGPARADNGAAARPARRAPAEDTARGPGAPALTHLGAGSARRGPRAGDGERRGGRAHSLAALSAPAAPPAAPAPPPATPPDAAPLPGPRAARGRG
uniref:uncharacterized protein LOC113200216 n=1 Tax=Urocitellus parryii TaxID=9999 RepID=UPI000E55C1D4|nr:uncharacterized protein LOC113200216 [Urocitellus parryii]